MRLNFEFSEEQVNELKVLQEETGASSMKDLFNNAFTILQWAVDETKDGNQITTVNQEDKSYRVLVMPILQKVARQATRRVAIGV